MDTAGKRVLILGLAREGSSLARFLSARGAHVTVTDSAPEERLQTHLREMQDAPVRAVLGDHHPELVAGCDAFFVSPGVPEDNPVYEAARAAAIPIQSMTTLFFELCPGRIIGVTGSSGKTTTTGLIGQILRTARRKSVLGGNIGRPMLDLLPEIEPDTIVVLELSSFQLSILRASPHIAVVTNISPNHLDRHGTMAAYVDAKLNIVRYQCCDDFSVLNAEDPSACTFARATPATIEWFGTGAGIGAEARDGTVGLVGQDGYESIMSIADIPLLGRHNIQNVLAACAATALAGVQAEAMAAGIRAFRPAPHRLETVGERGGVRFIDDSIATSPARASVALEAIDAPVILIAGGRDKCLPWDEFGDLVVDRVQSLFLVGEAADTIERVVRQTLARRSGRLTDDAVHRCTSLEAAVAEAVTVADPGSVVLLSPACASYDAFTDFEERGRAFARAVRALDAA